MNSRGKLWILAGLIGAGIAVAVFQPVEIRYLLAVGDRIADQPLFLISVIVLMAALYTFGLPGTLGLWLIAPFHPPLTATAILLAGSTSGAIGGYFLIRGLGGEWKPRGLSLRVTMLLARHRDFFTQCAFRILPGFPHSAVNFASGLLRLPLVPFIGAAVSGLAIKWSVYASAVYGIAETLEQESSIGLGAIWPLLVLTALLLISAWFRRRVGERAKGARGD